MRPIKKSNFILPRLLRLSSIVAILLIAVVYTSWQARFLIAGPEISITDTPDIVQNDRMIMLNGQASNTTRLYLNGRPIVTDPDGSFSEGVVLENGHTVVGIDAYDRYGRLTHWEQPLVYVESTNVVQR